MPSLPFKHIQSCSTSVPGYEPENLLNICRKTKPWKGVAGKDSNTVILRLEKEEHVRNVDIGNEFSAFIEVLVGKSCEPEAVFSVLVPSTSFMDPLECRNEKNGNRVKMFGLSHMNSSVAAQKWDLVKITCKQPFNKRLQYGITFVRLTGGYEEIQSDISITSNSVLSSVSRVLDNGARTLNAHSINKFSLLDENLVCDDLNKAAIEDGFLKVKDDLKIKENIEAREAVMMRNAKERKRKATMDENKVFNEESGGPIKLKTSIAELPLLGVRFTLSGFQNPVRGQLRDKGVSMGAVYLNEVDSTLTHLVCAFKNTPKAKQIGTEVITVTASWIEKCYIEKRKINERFFTFS